MAGYTDCSGWIDDMTFYAVTQCADEGTLMLQYILGLFAFGLLFLPLGFAGIFIIRNQQSEKEEEEKGLTKIF
jgi:hypothetical protein